MGRRLLPPGVGKSDLPRDFTRHFARFSRAIRDPRFPLGAGMADWPFSGLALEALRGAVTILTMTSFHDSRPFQSAEFQAKQTGRSIYIRRPTFRM